MRSARCVARWWACAAALAAVCGAAPAQCPRGCECAQDDLRWYYCGDYIVKARDDGYVEVNCQNTELNCSALPHLDVSRGEALQRLELTQCSLPPALPLACVAAAAGAAGGARALALTQAPGGLTEDNVRGLGGLESLFVSYMPGGRSPLPLGAVVSLPSLRRVRVLSAAAAALPPRWSAPGGAGGAPPLLELEVSMSGVAALSARAFDGLSHLTSLSLWGNEIADVSPDAFVGLESLQRLVLNSNPLGRLPPRVFAPAPRLRRLHLERVRLAALEGGVFEGLPELEELKVRSDSPAPLSLAAGVFSNLTSLASLSLTHSRVLALPRGALPRTLRNLTLGHNALTALPAEALAGLADLQRLDVSDNALTALTPDVFRDLKSLTEVNLDGNRIRELPERLFSGLSSLRVVSARRNLIASVSYSAFAGAAALAHLALAHNALAWRSDDLDLSSPFHMLHGLKTLDLSHNAISCVFSDWRYVLRLATLDLSYNNFTELSQSDVQYFGDMLENKPIEVDFRHNSISSIQARAPWSAPSPLARLRLAHNPFDCDCHLYDFLTEVRQPNQTQYDVTDASCSHPPRLADRTLLAVPLEDITCPVPAADACTCVIRPARARVECDCVAFASLPDLDGSGLADMALRLRTAHDLRDLRDLPESVTELNLTALGLTEIPEVPRSVRLLDLTRNRIEKVPKRFLDGNLTLMLAHNPLSCDCWSTEEVTLLQKSARFVLDYGAVTCGGEGVGGGVGVAVEGAGGARRVSRVDAAALCGVYRSAAAGLLCAAALVLAALAAAALYHYRLELQVYLHSRGRCLPLLPREPPDADKEYDVFVSFAPEDEKFVCEELLPRLEGTYRVHVQDRDWEVGGTIPAQLHRSVERSRRTLLVLSPHMLASLWAAEGFRCVHSQAAADRRPRAVVLLLGLRKSQLDEETRSHLSLATRLRYGEIMFWEKLAYALPRGDGARGGGGVRKRGGGGGGLNAVLNREGKLVNAGFVKDVV